MSSISGHRTDCHPGALLNTALDKIKIKGLAARVLAVLRAAPPEDRHDSVEPLMSATFRSPSAKTPRGRAAIARMGSDAWTPI